MKNGEKSFHKIFELIETIGRHRHGVKAKELSDEVQMPVSTVFRMLKFLVERNYLSVRDNRYCLGNALVRLGEAAYQQNSLAKIAHGILEELSDRTLETVHLAELKNNMVFYIDKVEGARSVRMASMIGKQNPLYCTGVGKALLAFLPGREVDLLGQTMEFIPFTPHTVKNLEELKAQLAVIRQNGVAIDDCEHEPGVFCIAAVVFNSEHRPVAAVSISGAEAFLKVRQAEFALYVKEAASAISRLLAGR